MTAPTFKTVSITDAEIEVAHLEEGHRYRLHFAIDKNGRRVLSEGTQQDSGSAKHSAIYFAGDARVFAEIEARARNKID